MPCRKEQLAEAIPPDAPRCRGGRGVRQHRPRGRPREAVKRVGVTAQTETFGRTTSACPGSARRSGSSTLTRTVLSCATHEWGTCRAWHCPCPKPSSSRPPRPFDMQRPLTYIRVFSDDTGESHIVTEALTVRSEQCAPPAPALDVSAISGATGWNLLRFAADWVGGWHCTPYRQWMFLLAGRAAVRASDGSRCDLRAGSICLLEDTRGRGHLTTIIGDEEVLTVAVLIPDGEPAASPCRSRPVSSATPSPPSTPPSDS